MSDKLTTLAMEAFFIRIKRLALAACTSKEEVEAEVELWRQRLGDNPAADSAWGLWSDDVGDVLAALGLDPSRPPAPGACRGMVEALKAICLDSSIVQVEESGGNSRAFCTLCGESAYLSGDMAGDGTISHLEDCAVGLAQAALRSAGEEV